MSCKRGATPTAFLIFSLFFLGTYQKFKGPVRKEVTFVRPVESYLQRTLSMLVKMRRLLAIKN